MKKHNAIISIIVPLYNVEKYLDKCIQSVMSQEYSNWELLLIDDGSTDSSPSICDEFASNDIRIKVIHKSNTGVSDSRNKALEIANGKYVIFLDADDYWYDTTVLETFVETAEKYDLDIVRGEYKAVDEDGYDLFERPLSIRKQQLSYKIISSTTFYSQIMCGENFLVLSLIRKEIIGNLRLNVNRSFLEDMEFYANLLVQPLKCMYIPLRFYAYRKNENSASYTPKVKHLIDSFSMTEVFDQCALKVKDEVLKKNFRYNSIMMYYWTLDTMSQNPFYQNRLSLINQLSLVDLNKKVCRWANISRKIYPLPIYISPLLGIYYFRFKHKIGRFLRNIMH